VYSKTEEELLQHVESRLELLGKNEFYAKANKCQWGVTETEFLGHIVTQDGSMMDPVKVKAVVDWPELRNPREVLQFKGLVGFYKREPPRASLSWQHHCPP
jgi:hypothetical protein